MLPKSRKYYWIAAVKAGLELKGQAVRGEFFELQDRVPSKGVSVS